MAIDTTRAESSSRSRQRSGGMSNGRDTSRTPWNRWRQGSGSLRGWSWRRLLEAAGVLVASVAGGFVVSVLIGGSFGRSVGFVVFSLMAAICAFILLRSAPPRGIFGARFLDIGWGLLVGLAVPFVAGALGPVFGEDAGWPALEAVSARWIALAVLAPLVIPSLQQLLFSGVLVPAVFAPLRKMGLSYPVAAGVAILVTAAAFAAASTVFADDMLNTPAAFPLVLGLVCSAWTMLSGQLAGAITIATTANATWVLLSLAGALLS